MALMSWHYLTSEVYNAASAEVKTADKLYFLSDTKQIMKGTENFSEAVELYTTEPATKATGRLYVNSTTLEGKIWDGTAFVTVVQPVQTALVSGDTIKPVSSKAVEDYVDGVLNSFNLAATMVEDVTFATATNTLTVEMTDGSLNEIVLDNVAASLTYDKATGALNVVNATGAVIGTGVNLDLERFIQAADYDHENGVITLTFNDTTEPLTIEVGDLVDTYTANATNTVNLTVEGNAFTADVKVSATAGNQLVANEDGLFVAAQDISGKADKVAGATAGNVATLTAEGNAADSGVVIGGAALADAANVNTLATEAAVAAIRAALETSIASKITKVAGATAGNVATLTADGGVADGGVAAGGETFKATTDAATLATEKAVETYVTGYAVAKTNVVAAGAMATTTAAASDEKVASEKAVVDALTWKTTV